MARREKGVGHRGSSIGICLALAAALLALLGSAAAPAQAAPPTIVATGVAAVTTTSARLEASINPNGRATTYRFEYGPEDCASNPCASLPVPEGKITAGSEPVQVSVSVEGLAPGTSHHFRVIAKSGGTGGGETVSPDRVFATYLEPQAFGSCPNDLFRTENPAAARIERSSALLPDCRAYERASPLDKNAGDVTGTVPLTRAGASGGKVSFVSTTGVPGGVGSQEFPAYLAGRGATDWATEGLLPPAEEGQSALVLGWTPDFEEVFSKASRVGSPLQTEFLMTPEGQAPVQIADYAPNMEPAFAGASTGAAEVLFESSGALPGVAGAIAGRPNLYLWDRASDQLLLAGVLNDGEAPAKGAFAGPYDWAAGETLSALSEGGASASSYTQEEHAISADGRAVYFTAAGTGKLYLRLNPAAPQSALDGEGKCTEAEKACTVQISASQKANGPGGGPDPAGARPAAFQGASADGAAAFFTSPEKLTNDANTGPEQEPAAIEQADLTAEDPQDTVGSCVPAHALGLAVDAKHIYWVDPSTEAIGRANLDCSGAEPIFLETGAVEYEEEVEPGVLETTLVPSTPRYLAVDGEHIYWTNTGRLGKHGEPLREEGTIGRADLSGNPATVDPDFIRGASDPQGIAVDSKHIYWANSLHGFCFEGSCTLFKHPSIGRAGIGGEDPENVFIELDQSEFPQGVAVDSSHIYWVVDDGNAAILRRGDLSGNVESEHWATVGENAASRGLAVDVAHIYLAQKDANRIVRTDLELENHHLGGELEGIKEAGHPFGVAVSAEHVFWSSNGEANPNPGNDLYRYREGALEDIALDSASEAGAEVQGVLGASEDGTYLYYAANGVPDGVANSPNARGEAAAPGDCIGPRPIDGRTGSCNLYLWHEDPATHAQSTTFIARLQIDGGENKTDATNWAPKTAHLFVNNTNFEKTAQVSPDGRTLLFRSQRRLTAYDNEGTSEFYRYRAGDPGPTCVSCNPTGIAPGFAPRLGSIYPSVVAPTNPASLAARNLSADGDRVFFETTAALVAEDTNGEEGCAPSGSAIQQFPSCLDVYEWEAQGSGACGAEEAVAQGGCLYLLSTGREKEPALFADASADGNDVYFFTRSRLVGDDEDQLRDLYDARVGGGLAAQNTALPAPPCEVEACKAQATPPPVTPSPGSASFVGPGNQAAQEGKPHCPQGKRAVKRHGKWRCVAKKHRRGSKTHHRRRGAGKGREGR